MSEPSSTGSPAELPLPFIRAYWPHPGQLLAGFYPGDRKPEVADEKLKGLLRCGVTRVISLMEETEGNHQGEPFVPYVPRLMQLAQEQGLNVVCSRFPIRDLSIPTIAEMVKTLDAIDDAIARKEIVYVHCWGGRGRTGTVVACYLLRHCLVREGEALAAVAALTKNKREHFWPTPETAEQQAFVSSWKCGQ